MSGAFSNVWKGPECVRVTNVLSVLVVEEMPLLLFHGCVDTDNPKQSWQNKDQDELAYACQSLRNTGITVSQENINMA